METTIRDEVWLLCQKCKVYNWVVDECKKDILIEDLYIKDGKILCKEFEEEEKE